MLGHPEIVQIRGRISFVFLASGTLRVDGHALLFEQESRHIEIPVAASTVLLLEPGTTVTHEAIKLCAHFQTLTSGSEKAVCAFTRPAYRAAQWAADCWNTRKSSTMQLAAARRLYVRRWCQPRVSGDSREVSRVKQRGETSAPRERG